MKFKIVGEKLEDEIEWSLSLNSYGEIVLVGNGKTALVITRSGNILDYTDSDVLYPLLGNLDLTKYKNKKGE